MTNNEIIKSYEQNQDDEQSCNCDCENCDCENCDCCDCSCCGTNCQTK